MKIKKFSENLKEIVDSTKHGYCRDCKHYKLGYSFADGFQCELANTKIEAMPELGYVDPKFWIGATCIYDERLQDLRKNK